MTARLGAALARCKTLLLSTNSSWYSGIPVWLRTMFIAMIPIFELRGAIPAAKVWGMPLWSAYIWAVIGNMIPVPFILLFLGPFSDWLRRHSRSMDRFFAWLFARTRRKHSKTYERWREFALCIFVAIPFPGTGAWTGSLAAFVFDVPFWPAMLSIFCGVLIAGVAVTVAVLYVTSVPLWLTLVSAALIGLLILAFWIVSRREKTEVKEPSTLSG
jgi:uncharacterized membrane protein